jgi:hypothetical protein
MTSNIERPERIRVKLLWKSVLRDGAASLLRRFPGGIPVWGGCRFIFDPDERDYDWLVVYDDLPLRDPKKAWNWIEPLPGSPAHSILVTAEPSSIKTYGKHFLAQFGHVLTSQEPWVIQHPNAIFSQPALLWFYGRTDERGSYDRMRDHPPVNKSSVISTVCSSKQQKHTLHQTRYEFTQKLRLLIPEMDVFGHGVRPIEDKAEALDAYRYHLAIENHVCRHHWTEKLSDAFLGHCLPFYYGCPNANEYFPEESFISIDIHQVAESAERIKRAIRVNEYERRLSAIREARRLVLEEYGIFAVLSRLIEARHVPGTATAGGTAQEIMNRHAVRRSSVGNTLSYLMEHAGIRTRHAFGRWLG